MCIALYLSFDPRLEDCSLYLSCSLPHHLPPVLHTFTPFAWSLTQTLTCAHPHPGQHPHQVRTRAQICKRTCMMCAALMSCECPTRPFPPIMGAKRDPIESTTIKRRLFQYCGEAIITRKKNVNSVSNTQFWLAHQGPECMQSHHTKKQSPLSTIYENLWISTYSCEICKFVANIRTELHIMPVNPTTIECIPLLMSTRLSRRDSPAASEMHVSVVAGPSNSPSTSHARQAPHTNDTAFCTHRVITKFLCSCLQSRLYVCKPIKEPIHISRTELPYVVQHLVLSFVEPTPFSVHLLHMQCQNDSSKSNNKLS